VNKGCDPVTHNLLPSSPSTAAATLIRMMTEKRLLSLRLLQFPNVGKNNVKRERGEKRKEKKLSKKRKSYLLTK